MIKDLRATIKQTFIYGLSNIAIKAAGLILLPLYTGSLTVAEYGELAILEIFAQFFVGVISLQIPSSLLRFGSDMPNPQEEKKLYFTALSILVLFAAIFLLVSLPLTGIMSSLIFESSAYQIHFKLIVFSICAEVLGLLPLQLLRLKEKSIQYLLFVVLKLLSLVGFVWYFVVFQDEKVYGAVKAILFSNLIFLLATLPLQFGNLRLSFSKVYGLSMYKYGAPLVFTTVSAVLLTISDRAIIKFYGEFAEVGIYTLAYKIGSLSNLLIIASFSLGFLPIAFKKINDADFKPFFSKTLTLYVALTAFLTLFISVFGFELTQLFSSGEKSYWLAAILVPFIAFIFIFKALNNYFAYTFLLTKQTKYHAQITMLGVFINIGLNFLLVADYGMYGAVAATGLSYAAMTIVTYRIARRILPIQYEMKRVVLIPVSCAVFIAIALTLNDLGIIVRVGLKSLLVITYLFLLYRFGTSTSEKNRVKKLQSLLLSKGGIKKIVQEL